MQIIKNPWFIYAASIVAGFGGWLYALPTWSAASTPQAIGGLLLIVASVTATASGGSIIKPNQQSKGETSNEN
jgi:uncharacterized membrane protein